MTSRFNFLDDEALGSELLRRGYDLTVRITKCCDGVFGSFKLEGNLLADRDDELKEDEEPPPEELDVKLLRRLLDRFEKADE